MSMECHPFSPPFPSSLPPSQVDTAAKFYRYGMVLKQSANFYNNISTEMIPCQKPMMLKDALEFEKVGFTYIAGLIRDAESVFTNTLLYLASPLVLLVKTTP